MMSLETARAFIASMSWPKNAPRPVVRMMALPGGAYSVLLHHQVSRGWKDVAHVSGLAPERALADALEQWLVVHKLNDRPMLYAEIKRLAN